MKKIDVTEYTITTDKFPKSFTGYKFIVLSDLHSNDYRINLHKVNDIIKDEKPDAVLIAGDMINGKAKEDISDTANYLIALAKNFPVFYANGNHEYRLKLHADVYGEKYYEYRDFLTEAGVVFLEDETVFLEKDDTRLALSGLEIDSVFYGKFPPVMGDGLIYKHLGDPAESSFNLLIAHNPDYFMNYAKWGADLIVAGHVHGGIIRLPKLGGVIATNSLKPFPYFDGGLYEYENSSMVVGRGIGTHTINIRINNHPEVVVLKILAKN